MYKENKFKYIYTVLLAIFLAIIIINYLNHRPIFNDDFEEYLPPLQYDFSQ